MTEVNGHIYKRALMNAEDKLKERGQRIAELKTERDSLRDENARMRDKLVALAELAYEVHVVDGGGRFYCPVCRGDGRHREWCAWALAIKILEEK